MEVKLSDNVGVSLDALRSPKTSPVSRTERTPSRDRDPRQSTAFSPSRLRQIILAGDDRAIQYLRSLPIDQLKQAQLWVGLCSYPDCDKFGPLIEKLTAPQNDSNLTESSDSDSEYFSSEDRPVVDENQVRATGSMLAGDSYSYRMTTFLSKSLMSQQSPIRQRARQKW